MGALIAIAMFCSRTSWASSPTNQKPVLLHITKKLIETDGQRNASASSEKIVVKATNTTGLSLSDITVSIQTITEGMIYGSSFEDVATTDKKNKLKITGLIVGEYIVRASPSSNKTYLPNDKFSVTVKPKKTRSIKIKLSASLDATSVYVGSTTCLVCHPDQKDWEDTAHSNTTAGTTNSPSTVITIPVTDATQMRIPIKAFYGGIHGRRNS